MQLNALSIVYPAATRIAEGRKTLEIRSWQPPVLPLKDLLIVENHRRLECDGDTDPNGLAVALVDVTHVRPWTPEDAERDGHTFAAGYHAWLLTNVRPIAPPLRVPAERLIYQVTIPKGALA